MQLRRFDAPRWRDTNAKSQLAPGDYPWAPAKSPPYQHPPDLNGSIQIWRKLQPKPLSSFTHKLTHTHTHPTPLSSLVITLHTHAQPPFSWNISQKKMAPPNETKISVNAHSSSIETKINTMASLTPPSSLRVIQRAWFCSASLLMWSAAEQQNSVQQWSFNDSKNMVEREIDGAVVGMKRWCLVSK